MDIKKPQRYRRIGAGSTVSQEMLRTYQPLRGFSLESDVLVPAGQALCVGVFVSPAVTLLAYKFAPALDWWLVFPLAFFGLAGLTFLHTSWLARQTCFTVQDEPLIIPFESPAPDPKPPPRPPKHPAARAASERLIPVDEEKNKPAMFWHDDVAIDPRDMWQFVSSDNWSRSAWVDKRRPMESGGTCTRPRYDALAGYLEALDMLEKGTSGKPAQLTMSAKEIDAAIGCREKIERNAERRPQFVVVPSPTE